MLEEEFQNELNNLKSKIKELQENEEILNPLQKKLLSKFKKQNEETFYKQQEEVIREQLDFKRQQKLEKEKQKIKRDLEKLAKKQKLQEQERKHQEELEEYKNKLAKQMNITIPEEPEIKETAQTTQKAKTFSKSQLFEFWEDFQSERMEREKNSNASMKAYDATKKIFFYFLKEKGNDLSFSFFKDLQSKIRQLPPRFTTSKLYKLEPNQALKKIKEQELEKLNVKTVNRNLSIINLFVDYLAYIEKIEINHCSKLILDKKSNLNPKLNYTKEDVKKIFEKLEDQKDKDFCKFALYTGLRIGEIYNLKGLNIDLEEKLITITQEDTSNKFHKRIIPIHKNIFEMLEKIVNNLPSQDNKLFDFDKSLNATMKAINRKLKKIIPDTNKTFHSFRKCFSQSIENSEVDEKYKEFLLGNSLSKNIRHKIYNLGKVNTKMLRKCIDEMEIII